MLKIKIIKKIIVLPILLLASFVIKAQNVSYEKLDSISLAISQYQLRFSNLVYNNGKYEVKLDFPKNNFQIFYSTGKATKAIIQRVENTEFVYITENIDLSKSDELYKMDYPGRAGVLRMSFPSGLTTQIYVNGKYSTTVTEHSLDFFFDKNAHTSLKTLLNQLQGMFNELKLGKKIPKELYVPNTVNQKTEPLKTLTIEDIINKYIDALGGAEKLTSIKSVVAEGVLQTPNGDIPAKSWFLHNQGMRMDLEIQGRTNISVATPNKSWTLYPVQKQKKPVEADPAVARESAEELDLTGDLFNYKIKGNSVELLNKEMVDGKEMYKIKIIRKSGTVIKMFIDASTFLTSRRIINKIVEGKVTEMTEYISGYKKTADGYVYASSYQLMPSGMNLKYTKYEINSPVNPNFFEKP